MHRGRYAGFGLSDFAVVSFQRVEDSAVDMVAMMNKAATELRQCSKLAAVCYDAPMTFAVAFTSTAASGEPCAINMSVLHSS